MNAFLRHVINKIKSNLKGVKAIVLGGSRNTDHIVDFWSDTDLTVILQHDFNADEQLLFQVIKEIGTVVGSEKYRYSGQSIMYRTAIEYECSVQLLDIHFCSYGRWITTVSTQDQPSTIVYGHIDFGERTKAALVQYSFDTYDSDNTWFKYFIAIKKFARNDHLIGMHLLMDLVKEYLVVEMIERDIKHGTNIHRFGYEEQLPAAIKLTHLDESNKRKIFDYIDSLAYEYDKILITNMKNYESKYAQVADYLEKSKSRKHKGIY